MLMHPSQIGLENPGGVSYTDIDGLQHLSAKDVDIDISGAWLRTVGSPETVVAIIDDGIDLSTPELKANVYTNTKEIPCNGLDDDSNGFLDDYQGYDAELKTGCTQLVKRIVPNPEVRRIRGFGVHGTAMALALASPPLSSTSTITGVAPGVRFIPVSTGPSIDRGLSHAYAYIIAMKRAGVPIRVVNLSIGQSNPLPWACSTTTKTGESLTILGELLASGLTVVAAAGNEGSNNDTTPVCPSNLARSHAGVISVGAVDFEGKLPFFSNFGEKSVTISAPGTAIYTGYGYQTGTSIATALVSGVVALMYSANPQLTSTDVKRIIIETAKMPDLNLPTQSRGIISAGRALNAVPGRWGPAFKKP
jgi:subtilisin family serine protease